MQSGHSCSFNTPRHWCNTQCERGHTESSPATAGTKSAGVRCRVRSKVFQVVEVCMQKTYVRVSMYVCMCVWRTLCETREGWQLNSELTHDSTTSTHSVLYTAALTEPNSHFILVPLSFSLCAPLCCSLPPSIYPSIHPSLLNLLSISNISFSFLPSVSIFPLLLPSTHLFWCVHFYAISSPLFYFKLLDFGHNLSLSTVCAQEHFTRGWSTNARVCFNDEAIWRLKGVRIMTAEREYLAPD